MLKKNRATALVVSLALALMLVNASSVGAATTKVSFAQQPSITVRTGQTFYLTVYVSEVADLYAWQFNVDYNPAYLEFLRVVEGPMLQSDEAQTYFVRPTTASGKVLLPAVSRLAPADTGVSGSGEIAYVIFRALKETSGTSVTVKELMLVDRNALEIDKDYLNSGRCSVAINNLAPPYEQLPIESGVVYIPMVRR